MVRCIEFDIEGAMILTDFRESQARVAISRLHGAAGVKSHPYRGRLRSEDSQSVAGPGPAELRVYSGI